jgi:hypothetical protein
MNHMVEGRWQQIQCELIGHWPEMKWTKGRCGVQNMMNQALQYGVEYKI